MGAALAEAQGRESAREMSRRSAGRFSATTWRWLVTGIRVRQGEASVYRPDPQTVIDAARVAELDQARALRMAGFDPENLPAAAGQVGRPDLEAFTDDELLREVRDRLRGRHGNVPVDEPDNLRHLPPPDQPASTDDEVMAARDVPGFKGQRLQQESDTLGEESQDPGGDDEGGV